MSAFWSHAGSNTSEKYPRRIGQGLHDASCVLGSMLSSLMGLTNPAWVFLGSVRPKDDFAILEGGSTRETNLFEARCKGVSTAAKVFVWAPQLSDFTKMRANSSVCSVRKLAYPIRRGYFAEMLFPTWARNAVLMSKRYIGNRRIGDFGVWSQPPVLAMALIAHY